MISTLTNMHGETISIDYSGDVPIIRHSDCKPGEEFFYVKRNWLYKGVRAQLISEGYSDTAFITNAECDLIEKDLLAHDAKPVELLTDDKHVYLSYELCPLCMSRITDTRHSEKHHVIWHMDRGADSPANLLKICKDCHGLITREGLIGSRLNMYCVYYMIAELGEVFIHQESSDIKDEYIIHVRKLLEEYKSRPSEIDTLRSYVGERALYGLTILNRGKPKHIRQLPSCESNIDMMKIIFDMEGYKLKEGVK